MFFSHGKLSRSPLPSLFFSIPRHFYFNGLSPDSKQGFYPFDYTPHQQQEQDNTDTDNGPTNGSALPCRQ